MKRMSRSEKVITACRVDSCEAHFRMQSKLAHGSFYPKSVVMSTTFSVGGVIFCSVSLLLLLLGAMCF